MVSTYSVQERVDDLLWEGEKKFQELKKLLEKYRDLGVFIDEDGNTLLHMAARYGNKLAIDYFLSNKLIGVDVQNNYDETPLMHGVKGTNSLETTKALLSYNPNLRITAARKSVLRITLGLNVRYRRTLEVIIDAFKEEGEFRDSRDIAYKLMRWDCSLMQAMVFNDAKITKIMLDWAYPVNIRDEWTGETPLHLAVEYGNIENIKLLISHGARVNAMDEQGSTPYFWIPQNNVEMQQLLIDHGASFTILGPEGNFLLEKARFGTPEKLRMILKSNINMRARDFKKRTPLHIISNERGVLRRNPDIIEILRTKKFDVNACDTSGVSLLKKMIMEGLWEMAQLLLERGADPNIRDLADFTPIYEVFTSGGICASYGDDGRKCIELLIYYGADIQVVNFCQRSIIDYAISQRCFEGIELIMAHLILLQNRGTEISPNIIKRIDSHRRLKASWNKCKEELDELKTVEVFESVTFYDILKKKITALPILNKEFLQQLKKSDVDVKSNLLYSFFLQTRIRAIIEFGESKRETIDMLCKAFRWDYGSMYVIADKIAECLLTD